VERNRISSLQSHGKALKKECCLLGVFRDSGDTPANLLCELSGHLVPCASCFLLLLLLHVWSLYCRFYDPADELLRRLFVLQDNSFPPSPFTDAAAVSVLRELGLRGIDDVDAADIRQAALCIAQLATDKVKFAYQATPTFQGRIQGRSKK